MKFAHLTLAAAVAAMLSGCDKPESRIAPIAHVLSFVQRADLYAAGVVVPDDGREFLLSAQQARRVFAEVQPRSRETIDAPRFERYAVFLQEVSDPVVMRARIERGHPRPFCVIVYEVGPGRALDRTHDAFFLSMKKPNQMPEP